MESKKKFVKRFSYFLVFSLLFYIVSICLVGFIFPNGLIKNLNFQLGGTGHLYTRLNEVKKVKKIDVLFIGSSLTYRGYDTRIFSKNNINSFNLGSSSQTPIQSEILIDKYLDAVNPKVIVLETNPEIFSSDGIESTLDLIANCPIDTKLVLFALKQNHIKVYNALILSLCRNLLGSNNNYFENIRKGTDTYISGGFVQKDSINFESTITTKNSWTMNSFQEKSFENMIQKIKEKGIGLLFVQPPTLQSYSHSELFDQLMQKHGLYYNFNKIMPEIKDSIYFYDNFHLNQKGVEKYNRYFIEHILKE